MIAWLKSNPFISGLIAVAAIIFLGLWLWFYGTQAWNGLGKFLFHRQINAERVQVRKELDDAAALKKVNEQTLLELKQAKEDYAREKAAREKAEQLFYDQSKTASQKVAEFKQVLAKAPDHTPTDGITSDDLCARAKATSDNSELIAALCGK